MTVIDGYFYGDHVDQFDGSFYEDENCSPTSAANGANNATGGGVAMTGGQVRALIPRSAETDPHSPGWSIPDVDHAMAKVGVGFTNHSQQGWGAALTLLAQGHYLAVQGDSDQFPNGTCSGRFNGNHCIGIHPGTRIVDGERQHWIDDPICQTGRWEYDRVLRAYATKLDPQVRFGAFTTPVPRAAATRYVVTIGADLSDAEAKLPKNHTPLYSAPGGHRVGAVSKATYICTRRKVDGRWWYCIKSKADGSHTANAGRWFGPNRHTKARYA